MPIAVPDMTAFCQVCKADDVSGISRCVVFVCYPNLNAVDGDAAGYVRQLCQSFVVIVTEEMGKKEVAVGLIVICANLKCRHLVSARGRYAFAHTFFL